MCATGKLMLTLLSIRNLALVDQLQWELGRGLIAVTGETGAGKSVIVGALKLVLGERADKSLIRSGAETCTVEAVFELDDSSAVDSLLEQAGLPACEEKQLIIRRVIGGSSNRQFINSAVATLGVLKSIGVHLVDLHGPHDHQGLLSVERQLAMLDAFAGNSGDLAAYRECYADWSRARREWEALRDAADASDQELELLRHQADEIADAELKPEEEEEIQERYRRANNSARLVETTGNALRALSGIEGDGLLDRLSELQRAVNELERQDSGVLEFTSGLESAALEMQELEGSLEAYLSDLEIDPEEAAQLEQRINLFESLKRKYGPTLVDVLEHLERVEERLNGVENRSERLAELEEAVRAADESLKSIGRKLGAKRKKAAPRLAKAVAGHLADLGFKQATFEIQLCPVAQAGPSGLEAAEFQFGPNPGEPVKALRQIASSGEISRVMLALKTALADQDSTPLMVFDEIDANVGGEIARSVGEKMAALGEQHQVVSITHFPQVAAVAARHFLVVKEVAGQRTVSTLREVAEESRLDELVRMLGGGGEQARALAESMLKG